MSISWTGPCVCDWLFRLCAEDQMCLSVPNTSLVPVCVIGYLDCVLRTRCVYQYLTLLIPLEKRQLSLLNNYVYRVFMLPL